MNLPCEKETSAVFVSQETALCTWFALLAKKQAALENRDAARAF
jgi:hypothetical protein